MLEARLEEMQGGRSDVCHRYATRTQDRNVEPRSFNTRVEYLTLRVSAGLGALCRSKPGFKATELSVRLEMARRAATAGHITTDELRKQLETRQREYDELQASHQVSLTGLTTSNRYRAQSATH